MLASLLLVAGLQFAGGAASVSKVNARLFAGKAEGERASFLVVLRERADLSGASTIPDRLARRRFVYETLRAHAEATQAPLRQQLARAGVPFRPHFLVNMIEVEGDRTLAQDLAASADVSMIEPNLPSRLELPKISGEALRIAAVDIEPNIQKVRAPELWDRSFTGQEIVVGIADSGFQWDHPSLKNQYRGWDGSAVSHDYNWHDAVHDPESGNPCGSDSPVPCDDGNHGTATSGIAVGDDGAGNRIGVAPGARLIGCRNMDRGSGTPARYTECFEWLLAPTDSKGAHPRPDLGADVINNSWYCGPGEGCESNPDILRTPVENLRAAGVAVVVAAGNGGFACGNVAYAPAIYDASITIGATDNEDRYSGFSSPGPVRVDGSFRMKPDLCAPGVFVRTAATGSSYQSDFSGTSASAPHVAGAIALLWSAIPALRGDVDETELVLEAGAVPLTSPLLEIAYPTPEELDRFCGGYSGLVVPNPIFGWGRLDVAHAYLLLTVPKDAPREDPILPARQPPRKHVIRPRP